MNRALCLGIKEIDWQQDPADGTFRVTWSPHNIVEPAQLYVLNAVPLYFVVKAAHAVCDNGAGEEGTDIHMGIESWAQCAQLCHDNDAIFCNHNRITQTCKILWGGGKQCFAFHTAIGWFALEVVDSASAWGEKAQSVTLSTYTHRSRGPPGRSQTATLPSAGCVPDDIMIDVRVALNEVDKGKFPDNTDPTGIELVDKVFATSGKTRFRTGNTAPTFPKEKVTIFPKVIYPTSPWISCGLPSHAITSVADDPDENVELVHVASYAIHRGKHARMTEPTEGVSRLDRTVVGHLLHLLLQEDGYVREPVDHQLWPGDLRLLAQTIFPQEVRENSDLLRQYILQCLSDREAVTDVQMQELTERVSDEVSFAWNMLDRSDGGDKTAFGRTALFGTFQHSEKFRCAIKLSDYCEQGQETLGSEEVTVTPLSLKNYPVRYAFDAGAETRIEIVGAGFVTRDTRYNCIWSQPSQNIATYQQMSPGVATSFREVGCVTPKWLGDAGSVEISLSGPVLTYQGCFNLDTLVNAVNSAGGNGGGFTTHSRVKYLAVGWRRPRFLVSKNRYLGLST